jgi:hypothetical protein
MGLNNKFTETKLYADFRAVLIKSFIKNLRKGRILVRGNYSTLFGNPMEMLEESIGMFKGESKFAKDTLHSLNFNNGAKLLGSRSPHVTIANTLLVKNRIYDDINTYFNLTNEIACVNSIGENLLERLSGADFDSDTLMLTNNEILIKGAERNYNRFRVPTNMISRAEQKRLYSPEAQADLDICTSINKIGEIINLSQELNSKLWSKLNEGGGIDDVIGIYTDAAKLDVMSNLEIDSAKKENPADNTKEMDVIKNSYDLRSKNGLRVKPMFFKHLDREKGYYDPSRKTYEYHETTMDYLQKHINRYRSPKVDKSGYLRFFGILKDCGDFGGRINQKHIRCVINKVREAKAQINGIYGNKSISKKDKYLRSLEIKKECADYIGKQVFGLRTMYHLLTLIEEPIYSDISGFLIMLLFNYTVKSFFDLISHSAEPIGELCEASGGEVNLYDFNYTIK